MGETDESAGMLAVQLVGSGLRSATVSTRVSRVWYNGNTSFNCTPYQSTPCSNARAPFRKKTQKNKSFFLEPL